MDTIPCQCEHTDHYEPKLGRMVHAHLAAAAGSRRALHVGPICDPCADGHLSAYILRAWSVSLVWNGTDRIMHGRFTAPSADAAKSLAGDHWNLPTVCWPDLVAEEV